MKNKKIPSWFNKKFPPVKPMAPVEPSKTVKQQKNISEFSLQDGDESLRGLYEWLSKFEKNLDNGCVNSYYGNVEFSVFETIEVPNSFYKKDLVLYEKSLTKYESDLKIWEQKMAEWNAVNDYIQKKDEEKEYETFLLLKKKFENKS